MDGFQDSLLVAVRLYELQAQLIASAHSEGLPGMLRPGSNSDAWILAAIAVDSTIVSPRLRRNNASL